MGEDNENVTENFAIGVAKIINSVEGEGGTTPNDANPKTA